MNSFKAKVLDNIPANRLVGLGGINRNGDEEEGWDTVYLINPKLGQIPDLVATGELKEGAEVNVSIKNNPIWSVEAAERIPAGTLVQCTDDGRVKNFSTEDGSYIGFSTHSAEPGEVVSFVRKSGAMPYSQVENMTYTPKKEADPALDELTNAELKELLDQKDIEYKNNASKKDLIKLLGGD